MATVPGLPQNSGGNNPAVAAAMSNLRQSQAPAPQTAPNQLPQGQAPGAALGTTPLGAILSQALQVYVQNGARPEDTAQIEQFFTAFVKVAEESKRAMAASAPGPSAAAAVNTQMAAPATPQPGAVAPA